MNRNQGVQFAPELPVQFKPEWGVQFAPEYPFIFREALKVVTATKKAICVAFNLNIENVCRYKRQLEKNNLLKQSDKKQFCKYTGHLAHYLTTNTELINSK